jgi:hypothetical protein
VRLWLWLKRLGSGLRDKSIPPSVRALAALAVLFAIVLTWIAVLLIEEFATGTGQIGHQGLGGLAASGLTEFSIVLLFLSMYLVIAGRRLLVRGKSGMLMVPLVLLVAYGLLGESIAVASGGADSSNAIGMVVLLLLALPLVIRLLPSSRRWLRSGGGDGLLP